MSEPGHRVYIHPGQKPPRRPRWALWFPRLAEGDGEYSWVVDV